MTHALLSRQLRKLGLNHSAPPNEEAWNEFLKRIEKTYDASDQERYLLERSLTISSEEMREVHEQLRASEKRYALAASGANDGLWDWDLVADTAFYSERWIEILGIVPTEDMEPCKECWLERIHPDDLENVVSELNFHLAGETEHFENEHRIRHTDGNYRWVLSRGMAVRNADGEPYRVAGSLTDITDRKLAEERLAYEAVHDALTGLPNRKRLMERLERTVKQHKYGLGSDFALLFIDLDRFKTINDSLGHQAGDKLLQIIAARIQKLVRPGDLVTRLGGDEFVVLLDQISSDEAVKNTARRLLESIKQPTIVNDQRIYSSGSIGIVIGSEQYEDADSLVRDADFAMYRAKAKGKGRFEMFDFETHSGTKSQLHLELDLRDAIENEEFVLHYQPIVSMVNQEIVGFESLVRWEHPTKGMIPPLEFIPVAEETGLIKRIGEWVLIESCRQMKEWQVQNPQARNLIISVNLSAKQLEQPDLVEIVSRCLHATGLDPTCLKLEITESVIMKNAEDSISKVSALRETGVRISIDDFGTGYSSLSYLHRFPIDTLKVDRSFISRIGEDSENSEIVGTIIDLGRRLGMDIVAEGVETEEQNVFLKRSNCTFGQGYFWSKPLKKEEAVELIDGIDSEGQMPVSIEPDVIHTSLIG